MPRVFPFLLLLLACAPDVPAKPNWVDDVGPILKANCVRCHGDPASGAAPPSFRLDRFRREIDFVGDPWGAGDVWEFVAHRAAVLGDMPPNGPGLTDRQKEILIRWAGPDAELGENAAPTMALVDAPASADQSVTLSYLVQDANADGILGQLFFTRPTMMGPETIRVSDALHGGRGLVTVDTGQLPAAEYSISATLTDGSFVDLSLVTFDQNALGAMTVAHADGNVAPTIEVLSPARDDMLIRGETPEPQLTIDIVDPDLDTTGVHELTLTVHAIRGADEVLLLPAFTLGANVRTYDQVLDFSMLPPAPNWRLRVTVSDLTAQRSRVTPEFIVSNPVASPPNYQTAIEPIVKRVCEECHNDPIPLSLTQSGLRAVRGLVWRRVVQWREMPPMSGATYRQGRGVLTGQERANLSEWLLAGANP